MRANETKLHRHGTFTRFTRVLGIHEKVTASKLSRRHRQVIAHSAVAEASTRPLACRSASYWCKSLHWRCPWSRVRREEKDSNWAVEEQTRVLVLRPRPPPSAEEGYMA